MDNLIKRIKVVSEVNNGLLTIDEYLGVLEGDQGCKYYEKSSVKKTIDEIYRKKFTKKSLNAAVKKTKIFTIKQINEWNKYNLDDDMFLIRKLDNNMIFISAMNSLFNDLVKGFKMKFKNEFHSCTFTWNKPEENENESESESE